MKGLDVWWRKILQESIPSHFLETMKTPSDLYRWLRSNVTTGWREAGFSSFQDFVSRYRVQSPEETFDRRTGACQDQAILIHDVLKNHMKVECEVVFLQVYNTYTHTFAVYREEGKLYIMENALDGGKVSGICGPFQNVDDAVMHSVSLIRSFRKAGSKDTGHRHSIVDVEKAIGLTIEEYLKLNGYDFSRSEIKR